MPFTGDVDPIEPETSEPVGPLVDPVESEVPLVEPVAPIFDVDRPAATPEAEAEPERKPRRRASSG